MLQFNLDPVEFITAAGALGVAAMAIVEGFKSTRLTPMGFASFLSKTDWCDPALKKAYGKNYGELTEALYRKGRGAGDLPRIMRQGIRIGLDENTAPELSEEILGMADGKLKKIAEKLGEGKELSDAEANILGRFEVAADARIDAALALAERAYLNSVRLRASIVALVLALFAAFLLDPTRNGFFTAVLAGVLAVPVAPIAKDIAKGFQAMGNVLGSRK